MESSMNRTNKIEAKLRNEFCVEVTEPLTAGEAREIALQFSNGGVSVAIKDNKNGTFTVWRKPFSDEWLALPVNMGAPVECCIMQKKHPKREELEVFE